MKARYSRIAAWQKATFPNATSESKCHHLVEEVNELLEETQKEFNRDTFGKELADCFILLIGVASNAGFDYVDVMRSIDEKMTINRKRKWGKPDANGVVKHVKI